MRLNRSESQKMNIEHPTSNIKFSMKDKDQDTRRRRNSFTIRCWMFDVRCSILFLCVLSVLCGSLTARAAEKVSIALNWVPEPEFGGIYAAREGGAFGRHN